MPNTTDRAKLGQTTYQWSAQHWEGDEPITDNGGEEDSLESAVDKAKDYLEAHDDGNVIVYVGTYESQVFEDDKYGTVFDAEWIWDESRAWYICLNADSEVMVEQS